MKEIRRSEFIKFLEDKIANCEEGRDRAIKANVGNSAACYATAKAAYEEVLAFINEDE